MSGTAKPTIILTGVSGNLGRRLVPQLANFQVIGVDLVAPLASPGLRFVQMDLGQEASCPSLLALIRELQPLAVVHSAFVIDPVRAGILDPERMWQANVAGTARVLEAITEANREAPIVQKFIFPSSVAVYGSDLAEAATEESPLQAHTLPYAIHKMEADLAVQQRAPALRGCSAFTIRPHIYAGATVENYLVGAFRGTPNGKGRRAERLRAQNKRLPCMLPYGQRYLDNRIQFVHVDDIARLIAYLLAKTEPEAKRLTVLNVAGRGEPLTVGRCIKVAQAKLRRVPGKSAFRLALGYLWKHGISAIPPEALPYMTGEYIMNTRRLQDFLGAEYENVIRYTVEEAFADCFRSPAPVAARSSAAG